MEDSENLGSSNEELLLQQEALILRCQQLERENAELKAASSSGPAEAPTRERGGSLLEQLADQGVALRALGAGAHGGSEHQAGARAGAGVGGVAAAPRAQNPARILLRPYSTYTATYIYTV